MKNKGCGKKIYDYDNNGRILIGSYEICGIEQLCPECRIKDTKGDKSE